MIFIYRIPTPDDSILETSVLFALNTGAVAAVLKNIPNQPTVFLVINLIIMI